MTATTAAAPFGGWKPRNDENHPPMEQRAEHFVDTAPAALRAIAEEIVATVPAMHLDTVSTDHPATAGRQEILFVMRGPRQSVMQRAAYHIARTHCAVGYEKHLPTLYAAELDDGDGQFAVVLATDRYVGA